METNGGCGVDNFYELNRDYGNLNRERAIIFIYVMGAGKNRRDYSERRQMRRLFPEAERGERRILIPMCDVLCEATEA